MLANKSYGITCQTTLLDNPLLSSANHDMSLLAIASHFVPLLATDSLHFPPTISLYKPQ